MCIGAVAFALRSEERLTATNTSMILPSFLLSGVWLRLKTMTPGASQKRVGARGGKRVAHSSRQLWVDQGQADPPVNWTWARGSW